MKILVAEDSPTMRKVMELTFAGVDAEVVAVDSAAAALKKLKDFDPDIILADGTLADVDGYELTEKIKERSSVPVVLLCSQHRPYDAGKGSASGVDDYINKPFDSQILIDKTRKLVQSGASASALDQTRVVSSKPPAARAKEVIADEPTGRRPPVQERAPAREVVTASVNSPEPSSQRRTAALPPKSVSPTTSSASAQRVTADIAARLGELGLSPEQAEGVLRISAEVVERVVWEVVPELAETMIREEIKRLTAANPAE